MAISGNTFGKIGANTDSPLISNSGGNVVWDAIDLSNTGYFTGTLPNNKIAWSAPAFPASFGINATGSAAWYQNWETITKSSNQDVTSNTTPANDSELTIALINTAAVYSIDMLLFVTSASATPGFKYTITGPGSPTVLRYRYYQTNTAGAITTTAGNAYGTTNSIAIAAIGSAVIEIDVTLENPSSNGGTFALQWSQNATSGTPTTVLKGSRLRYSYR